MKIQDSFNETCLFHSQAANLIMAHMFYSRGVMNMAFATVMQAINVLCAADHDNSIMQRDSAK